jgi:uncharacterized protein with GYD domain
MATGIAFMKWTEKGAHTYRETVDRLEPALKLAAQFGVEVKETFWTPGGPYDLIGISEAPDTKRLTAFCLALQAMGNLNCTWAEAYGPDQMREVIAIGG